ncbi:MAG TPA: hypothetical protein PLR28_03850 [Dokdonella sp.]|nr:hypothetical protein [Dokdonella sp.]
MQSNAETVAARMDRRKTTFDEAVRVGVLTAALKIDRAAIGNLTGSGAPYAYPVPVRTGNLRASQRLEQPQPALAILFNVADYAWAVHSGDVNEWRSHYAGASDDHTMAVSRRPRPFLDDAVAAVPYADIVFDKVIDGLRRAGEL